MKSRSRSRFLCLLSMKAATGEGIMATATESEGITDAVDHTEGIEENGIIGGDEGDIIDTQMEFPTAIPPDDLFVLLLFIPTPSLNARVPDHRNTLRLNC